MNEEDWKQILFDFRWSATARGHWLARFGPSKLVALCLRAISINEDSRLSRRLVVFLEEQFLNLSGSESAGGGKDDKDASGGNRDSAFASAVQRSVLFAVCETLNNVIVTPDNKPEAEQLRCQAISSMTVILISCNAYVQYRKLLLSFVTLLLSIVARVRSHADRQIRLVACESLKLLEYEYPYVSFVVPKHALSYCESETTHALQGYLVLLAAVMCKLVRKLSNNSKGEIEEAADTLSHHKNEIRQAALLLLDKLELVSPAAVVSITRDFLTLSSSAQIDHHDLWHNFYTLLHMSNPLILSDVLLFCFQADRSVSEADYYDLTYALIKRIEHLSLQPVQICHLLGLALQIPNSIQNLYKILEDQQLSMALSPSLDDEGQVISAKVYTCLKICSICSTAEQNEEEGSASVDQRHHQGRGATLQTFCESLQSEVESIISKGSMNMVKPLFNATKDFINVQHEAIQVTTACRILEKCFDKHPKAFSSCLDDYLAKIIKEDGEISHYQPFLDAVVGFFSKWIPNDYKFVGKDMHLLHHYFPCIQKLFTINTITPDLLLSALLYYVRCCIPREGNRNWGILETILALVRSVLKHHAINIHGLLEVLNELLQTIKDFADDPDTIDHCCFYLSLINSIDVTKLSLLMFDSDVKVNSMIQLKPKLPRKRNLNPQLMSVQTGKLDVKDRYITDFEIAMRLVESNSKPLGKLSDLPQMGNGKAMNYVEYEGVISDKEFVHTFCCDIVFDAKASRVDDGSDFEGMFALEISFETSGSGDIAFLTKQPILVPYVSPKTSDATEGPQSFEVRFKIVRPLPLVILPKVKFTDALGSCCSGHLKPIHLGIEHFCVPFSLGREDEEYGDKLLENLWHQLYNRHNKNWLSTPEKDILCVEAMKTIPQGHASDDQASQARWKKFQVGGESNPEESIQIKDCGGHTITVANPVLLLIFLPPKYHILVVISGEEEKAHKTARISTDFWPAMEYMDDFIESLM